MKNISNAVLIATIALIALIITAFVILAALGIETDNFVVLLTALIVPTFTSVLGLQKAGEAKQAAEDVHESVETVRSLVNGNTSRLLSIAEAGAQTPEDKVAIDLSRERLKASGYVETPAAGVPEVRRSVEDVTVYG